MKVCLISTEFLGWGTAGGFGFATRSLGRELAKRGVEVTAIVPRPRHVREPAAELDGVRIRTYARADPRRAIELFRECEADVCHSQEPSLGTWLAQLALPSRVHVVTSRDPRLFDDWRVELRHPTYSRLQVLLTALYYENPWTRVAVRRARRVYVPAHCLAERVKRKYGLRRAPAFLPTPIRLPAPETIVKAKQPTVCFVGRLDRRKRPQIVFELAARFPDVRFVVAGAAQDPRFRRQLDARYGCPANLELRGFIDQFATDGLSRILGESWILINPSAREGLPNSFIEACGHECAILSAVDPDGFASRFGARVTDGDFAAGLRRLLADGRWREAGRRGAAYVRTVNAAGAAVERHLGEYRRLL